MSRPSNPTFVGAIDAEPRDTSRAVPPAVRANGLVKRFGSVDAVKTVQFDLPARGVCGFLGPNGAGKTTTIRMLAGVLIPDEGTLEVCGHDALRDATRLRSTVGYLPESAPLSPELTVREHMRFRASLRGLSGTAARAAIADAMERTDVARFADRCAGTLSKGMQQRAGLAQTLLGDPKVLILDEPSVGLDPGQTLAFRALVRELGASRLVLLSSHLLSEVEDVCTELLVMAKGELLAHESMDVFRTRAGGGRCHRIECERALASIPAAARLRDDGAFVIGATSQLDDGWHAAEITLRDPDARDTVARALAASGVAVRVFEPADARLEEIFVSIVSGGLR